MERLQVVRDLLDNNPRMVLGGSLALKLQGFNLLNKPEDIDLIGISAVGFKAIEGISEERGLVKRWLKVMGRISIVTVPINIRPTIA